MRSSEPKGSNAFSILESLLMLVLLAVFTVVLTSLILRAMSQPEEPAEVENSGNVPSAPHPAFEPAGEAAPAGP